MRKWKLCISHSSAFWLFPVSFCSVCFVRWMNCCTYIFIGAFCYDASQLHITTDNWWGLNTNVETIIADNRLLIAETFRFRLLIDYIFNRSSLSPYHLNNFTERFQQIGRTVAAKFKPSFVGYMSFLNLGGDHLILRGGGGGASKYWSGQIIYFQHELGRKKYFAGIPRPEYLFSTATKKKKKKKKKKNKGGGGGGWCRITGSEGKHRTGVFRVIFSIFLQTRDVHEDCAYSVYVNVKQLHAWISFDYQHVPYIKYYRI